MNAEITNRLDTAYTKEELFDRFFGGPEMRRMATLWAAAFAQGAKLGAYLQHGAPFDSPLDQKEITDPTTMSYREGALAVVKALMMGMPTDIAALFIESLKGRFVSDVINTRRRAKGEPS
jgi:hypothetical protein